MNYIETKISFILSLQKNMESDQYEKEFDSNPYKFINYLMWGEKESSIDQINLLDLQQESTNKES